MNWVRAIAGIIIMLWSSTVWGATVTWTAGSEPDLAGYRLYQCSLQPCTLSSGNASLFVTLGTVASYNIGTPTTTQYYFVTAYDFANNASAESNLGTFTPAGVPPPSPPPAVSLKVVGDPATGPWGVEGSTTDLRDVMATVRLDGVVHHVEHTKPYGFPADNGTTATTGLFGTGSHTVEFVFNLEGTMTEIGRASVTLQEGSPPPPPPIAPPAIGASPTSLSFNATKGGADPATQTLSISNTGGGTLNWTAVDNVPWLTLLTLLGQASGTGNGVVTVSVATGIMAVGTYTGSITLSGTGAYSVTVPVTFTIKKYWHRR